MKQRGFTLIEMLIAISLGLIVAYIALAAVRMASRTVTAINRLTLENRLMRQGFLESLEEIDFWTRYDDPTDSTRQGLRRTAIMPGMPAQPTFNDNDGTYSPNNGLVTYLEPNSRMKLGLPFSPLSSIPQPIENQFAVAEPARVREVSDATGATDMTRRLSARSDLENEAFVFTIDRDRGFDGERPYQANDPRRWFRGNAYEGAGSDKRFGRYGIFTNMWKEPILGYGSDAREIAGTGRNYGPGRQCVTGPYGPYTGYSGDLKSRTFTWQANQISFLLDAMGNLGMYDYLPSGTLFGVYGGRLFAPTWNGTSYPEPYQDGYADPTGQTIPAPQSDATKPDLHFVRCDERLDPRLNGVPFGGIMGFFRGGAIGGSIVSAGDATSWATNPMLPVSPFTGRKVIGYEGWDNYGGYLFNNEGKLSNDMLPVPALATMHRRPWPGPLNHPQELAWLWNHSTIAEPLMPMRPAEWPSLTISVQRGMNFGRMRSVCRVRWTDNQTAGVAELHVTSIGTTLRGARQQRQPTQGWAVWYGPGDPRNSKNLDSQP